MTTNRVTDPTDPRFEPPRSSDDTGMALVLVATLGVTAAVVGLAWLVGGTKGRAHHMDEFLGPS